MTTEHDPYVLPDPELEALLAGAPWRRMVVVGDSIAEGVREPVEGWRDLSWTDRIALAVPGLEQRNLGVRDKLAAQVRAQQLGAALAFRPDLAVVSAGGNDALRPSFDPAAVQAELERIVAPLRTSGADVLLLELMDIVAAGLVPEPYAGPLGERLEQLAGVTREVAGLHGAHLVRMRSHPACADPTVYSSDRLHLTTRGHAIVATEAVRCLAAAPAAVAAA